MPYRSRNDPGRDWEGFETATRAAASGGITTLIDMPLNCVPETVNIEALEAKRHAASGKAWVDWAAWGGVVHGNACARVVIPLRRPARSLNVAVAGAVALAEALRQTGLFPA